MERMFYGAYAFNANVAGWNVASVSDMYFIFYDARAFNSDLAGWNVASVSTMTKIFQSAAAFDRNIADWNVRKVKSLDGAPPLLLPHCVAPPPTCRSACGTRGVSATLRVAGRRL
jgi:surface protein